MALQKCEKCGRPVADDDVFCTNCGVKIKRANDVPNVVVEQGSGLTSAGFCPECGKRTRAGWLFCMSCGQQLRQPTPGKPGVVPAVPTPVAVATSPSDTAPKPVTVSAVEPPKPAPPVVPHEDVPIATDSEEPEHKPAPTPAKVVEATVPAIDEPSGPPKIEIPPMPKIDVPQDRRAAPTIITTSAPLESSVRTAPVEGLDDKDDSMTAHEEEPKRLICMLRRVSTGENLHVENYPATLGRGTDATLRISGNRYVGRVHARIVERDGRLYVEDLDSANHTYLNGAVLRPHEETPFSDGDVLSLAKEDFRVTVTEA